MPIGACVGEMLQSVSAEGSRMNREMEEAYKQGLRVLNDIELLWFDLEKISREGSKEEQRVARELLKKHFP